MIGSPLKEATWNTAEGAIYNGAGQGEMTWLIVSIVLCVVAFLIGHGHEAAAYRKERERVRSTNRDY